MKKILISIIGVFLLTQMAFASPFNDKGQSASGNTTVQTSSSKFQNVIPMGVYNSTPPTPLSGNSLPLQVDNRGNLRVNPGIYNGAISQGLVSVATSSTSVLLANPNRSYMGLQNQDSTNPIWCLLIGGTATATAADIEIFAGGSLIFESGFIPNGPVSCIATGAAVNVQVLEGN